MAYTAVVPETIDREDDCEAADIDLNTGVGGAGAGNGIEFPNDGRTFIEVENGATQVVVTVLIPITVDGQAVADPTFTVPLNEDHLFGPFPPSVYNNANGNVNAEFDDITDGTVSVWRLS